MGVTIHYSGRLRDLSSYSLLIGELQDFSAAQGWPHHLLVRQQVTLVRETVEGVEREITGDTRGITLEPHENCEPLGFEFDRENVMQDYVKTQFAPPEIHIAIVELLQRIAPFFNEFEVYDEGEYWETKDPERLSGNLAGCFAALEKALAENAEAQGPVRLENGRILDVIM